MAGLKLVGPEGQHVDPPKLLPGLTLGVLTKTPSLEQLTTMVDALASALGVGLTQAASDHGPVNRSS